MRDPREKQRKFRPFLSPVPGGKALARLQQFEQERELASLATSPTPTPLATTSAAITADETFTAYLDAFQQLQQMQHRTMAVDIPIGWRPLGPFAIPHGQTYGSGTGSRPAVAGRISAVAVAPNNSNRILIGAAGGGVWESQNGGQTWQPRTDNQLSLAIGAIAYTPTNANIVYAGTGEGDFFSRLGTGLLRSTDGGTNWAAIATNPFVGQGFYDIIVDPANANHLFAALTNGLYESTNGGVNWTQRRSPRTWDLSLHPTNSNEVFAACQDGLFRSTNGGSIWSAVTLPGAPAQYSRLEVCHAPSNGNIVYVFGASGATAYLWRRDTFGGAFSALTPPAGLNTGQAWYDWFAAAAPNNPDVLYLGAIEVYRGVRAANGNWTWSTISAKNNGDSIHPDQHAIAFSPTDPNTIFVGNDGGIYRSSNSGTNWVSLNKGLCITEFEYIAQHPQYEAYLIGGTQDNGTLRYEGEEVWFHVQDGDGGDCGVNFASPYTCFHTFYGMGMERSTTGGGWGSWQWIGPNPAAGYNRLFYPPLEVNNNVVAQAGQSVFISSDNGTSWTEVALPSTPVRIASALAIPTTTRVYVGTTTSDIYRIDFTSGAWQAPVALTKPQASGFISDIMVAPGNAQRLWVTYSSMTGGHVFRSDNGGTSWTNVSAGLPNIPVNAIVADPANPNTVYLAADVGVYRSTNAGASWTAYNNLLPNCLVKDLVFHQQARRLRAATQSRGVWEIAVDQTTMPDVEIYLRDSAVDTGRITPSPSGVPNPFNVGNNTYWWQSQDIKIDALPYQTPSALNVDFQVFEDDHGLAASGLIHESPQRTQVARLYVQVHNRGANPATNVAVKAFYADASVALPNLPSTFWNNFPNNSLPASSPWKAVGPHKTIAQVPTGRAQIVEFDWPVPASAANHTCMLVIISAANDPINTTELNIGSLVTNQKKCALKNLAVINPPASNAPYLYAINLNLWAPNPNMKYSLVADTAALKTINGVLLPTKFLPLAEQLKLKKVLPTERHLAEVNRLLEFNPKLRERITVDKVFAPPSRGILLKDITINARDPEPLILLLNTKIPVGHSSILQLDDQGQVVGGFTFQMLEETNNIK